MSVENKSTGEVDEKLFLDMVPYAMAIYGIKSLLDEVPYNEEGMIARCIGMAEMLGMYDRETGTIALDQADLQIMFPDIEVFQKTGLL